MERWAFADKRRADLCGLVLMALESRHSKHGLAKKTPEHVMRSKAQGIALLPSAADTFDTTHACSFRLSLSSLRRYLISSFRVGSGCIPPPGGRWEDTMASHVHNKRHGVVCVRERWLIVVCLCVRACVS